MQLLAAGNAALPAEAQIEGLLGGSTTRLLLDVEEAPDAAVPSRQQEPAGRMAHVKDKMRRLTMAAVSFCLGCMKTSSKLEALRHVFLTTAAVL